MRAFIEANNIIWISNARPAYYIKVWPRINSRVINFKQSSINRNEPRWQRAPPPDGFRSFNFRQRKFSSSRDFPLGRRMIEFLFLACRGYRRYLTFNQTPSRGLKRNNVKVQWVTRARALRRWLTRGLRGLRRWPVGNDSPLELFIFGIYCPRFLAQISSLT